MAHEITVKSILNKTKKRDTWFLDDYTVNPYSACSFNCLFCYIRGSKYGEHMQRALSVKINAVELLQKQLANRAKKNQYGFIVLASATDPYLQAEQEYRITRQLLEVILQYRFPVHIITRSDLVTRDLDLLQEIDRSAILPDNLQERLPGGTLVTFSFSTLRDEIAKIFEPGATPPGRRLETVQKVKESGLRTGISLMPLLPWISDTTEELHHAYETFHNLKVDYVMPATLTLFGHERSDSKVLIFRAIEKHFPELAEKYHHYFDQSNEMPTFYRTAFRKKTAQLAAEYSLPLKII